MKKTWKYIKNSWLSVIKNYAVFKGPLNVFEFYKLQAQILLVYMMLAYASIIIGNLFLGDEGVFLIVVPALLACLPVISALYRRLIDLGIKKYVALVMVIVCGVLVYTDAMLVIVLALLPITLLPTNYFNNFHLIGKNKVSINKKQRVLEDESI